MKDTKAYINEEGEVRELDDFYFKNASRGRPPLPPELKKQQVTILLDPDIISHFKKEGKGWQTRLNNTLRTAITMEAKNNERKSI